MAIQRENGTCPCKACQLAQLRLPARKALIKRAKMRGDQRELARLTGTRR
jgi:hypothetical protein